MMKFQDLEVQEDSLQIRHSNEDISCPSEYLKSKNNLSEIRTEEAKKAARNNLDIRWGTLEGSPLENKQLEGTLKDVDNKVESNYEELLKRLQGKSDKSRASTDPFVFAGEIQSTAELNGGIDPDITFNTLLDSMHANNTESDYDRFTGIFRINYGGSYITVINIPISYIKGTWSQTIEGTVNYNPEKGFVRSNTFRIFRRNYDNEWSDPVKFMDSEQGDALQKSIEDLQLSDEQITQTVADIQEVDVEVLLSHYTWEDKGILFKDTNNSEEIQGEAFNLLVGNDVGYYKFRVQTRSSTFDEYKVIKSNIGSSKFWALKNGITGYVQQNSSSGFKFYDTEKPTSEQILALQKNIPSDYTPNVDAALTMPNAVGGISKGTSAADLSGKTFSQLFDDLLFPTINPTFTTPSATIKFSNYSTTQEVGAIGPAESNFATSYNAGAITLNGTKQANRGGTQDTANSFIYVNGDVTNKTLPTKVILGNTTFKYRAAYAKGPQPKDNKGNNYLTPLAAGTVDSSAITLNGTYPWYASTNDATAENPVVKQTLVAWSTDSMSTGQFTVQPSGTLPQVFKLPRQLKTLQLKNALNGAMETIGTSDYTETTETINIGGIDVTYYVYTYNGSTRGSVTLLANF